MATPDERFQFLLREAHDDPNIVGLVLTGSRGKGFGSANSDYDVLLVVREESLQTYRDRFYEVEQWEAFDWWVSSLSELEPIALSWDAPGGWDGVCALRYSFANVSVLLDKTGRLRNLIEEKGSVPEERRIPLLRGALGGFTNSLYRSLKCLRNRNQLGAKLEAADAIGHALTAIFALEGRYRPYYGYLERELRTYPLQTFPLSADELLALFGTIADSADAATQQRLLGILETFGRQLGLDDVFDEWWGEFDWMKTYRPDALSA